MRRILVATLLGVVAIATWWLLAPRQLPGGSAGYVVPSGSSMQPALDGGDLVVTRTAPGYRVGDVIAFASDELDRTVLHRIVRVEGDRYVTKGDNNEWLDRDRPTDADVLGRMVLRVPGGGAALAWIRTPRNAAMVGTVAAVVLMGGAGVRRRRRRRRNAQAAVSHTAPSRRHVARRQASLRPLAASLAVATFALGAASLFLHLRPATRSVPTRVPYDHTGSFGYVAVAEPGAVYPDGRVDAGEPVFLKVADMVAVRFVYRFSSERPHGVSGSAGMSADLEDGTGWRRSFEIQASAPFTGDEAVAAGTLDLGRIGALIREVEAATEIPRPTYTLTLRPTIEVEGAVAGRRVAETYSPELHFEATPLMLRLPEPEPPADDRTDALSVERKGAVVVTDRLPNPISMGPVTLDPLRTARLTLLAAGVAAALLLVVGVVALRRPHDEGARIGARYGGRLVPIAGGVLEGPVVDVATIDALARVADSYERMILYDEASGRYMVEGDVALYRYQIGAPAEVPDEPVEEGPSFLDEPPDADTRFLDEAAEPPAEPEPVPEPEPAADEAPTLSEPASPGVVPTPAASPANGVPPWPPLPSDDETRWSAPDGYRWVDEDGDDGESDGEELPAPEEERTHLAGDFFLR